MGSDRESRGIPLLQVYRGPVGTHKDTLVSMVRGVNGSSPLEGFG